LEDADQGLGVGAALSAAEALLLLLRRGAVATLAAGLAVLTLLGLAVLSLTLRLAVLPLALRLTVLALTLGRLAVTALLARLTMLALRTRLAVLALATRSAVGALLSLLPVRLLSAGLLAIGGCIPFISSCKLRECRHVRGAPGRLPAAVPNVSTASMRAGRPTGS
jgi:hypothetical protein